MAKQFWVRRDGQVSGPYTATQLKQMGAAGQVSPADEVSTDQTAWVPATKVGGLLPADAAADAPAPPRKTPAVSTPAPGLYDEPTSAPPDRPNAPAEAPGLYDEPAPAPAPLEPPNAPVQASGLYDAHGAPTAPAPVHAPPRKSRKGLLLLILVLAGGAAGFWYYWPWQVNRAMKYAPPGTIGVIHLDVEALAAEAIDEMAKHKDKMPGMDWDQVRANSEKVASVDVYLVDQGAGAPPGPFVILHGTLNTEDMKKAFASGGELPFTQVGNGRYDLTLGPMVLRMVFGDQADDVPKGLMMIGPAPMMAKGFFKKLGTGESKALRKALRGVNGRAPIWGGIVMPQAAGQGGPRSVAGHSDPRKGGKTRLEITFRTADEAKQTADGMKNMPGPFGGMFEAEQDGKVVVLKADHEQSLFAKMFNMMPAMSGPGPGQ